MMLAGQMLSGGARLVRTHPGAVAVWGVLYLAVAVAMAALIWPSFGALITLQQQAAAAQAARLAPLPPDPAVFAGLMGAVLLVDLALLLLVTVIFAAAVRATAAGGRDRFAFLRLGMDELRLIGLFLIVALGWCVLSVAAVLLLVIIAVIMAAIFGQQSPALLVIVPLYVALYGISIWLLVRLSLSGALTVLRGRIVLREAWRLTRGRFWTLFGIYVLIWLAIMLVSLVAVAVTNPAMLSFYANGMQPHDAATMLARQQEMLAALLGPRMIVTWLVGTAVGTIVLAFACGAVATAAIALDAQDAVGSEQTPPDRT